MRFYSETAMEKAMTRQEVILRAYAKKLTWVQAAEIIGCTPRQLRRIKAQYEQFGFHALFDKRVGRTSSRRVPIATVEEVLRLYREEYFDFNVSHFHEKLVEKHSIEVSYTWTKCLLQASGLVAKDKPRKKHHKRRPRRPLSGMLLHIDGSQHQWFGDERWFDLIVILDDATTEIYYAQLVEAESTRSVMTCIRAVIETKGVFCALYSDRASHFLVTPKAGEAVDKQALTRGRTSAERTRHSVDSRLFAASARQKRAFVSHLAGQAAAGAENQKHRDSGRSQSVSANRIHAGIQPSLHSRFRTGRHGVCALSARRL